MESSIAKEIAFLVQEVTLLRQEVATLAALIPIFENKQLQVVEVPTEPEWLSSTEAARLSRYSINTLGYWRRQRLMPKDCWRAVPTHGHLRPYHFQYHRERLLEWLKGYDPENRFCPN